MRFLLLLTALLSFSLVPTARAQTLDLLVNSLDQRREQADEGRDSQLKKLRAAYSTALRRLLDRTKTGGDLDAVRPVNDEITAIEDGADSLPPLPDTAPAELKKLRATFDDSRHKILTTHATTLTDLADKADAALRKMEADLTRAGKIDTAVAARNTREELAKDQAITDARDLVKLGGSATKGKPALQLRRYGDNLEVLVFHDRLGKISMDSPVENTRERTGEGKELGDTKAKTLGEFVGAKGYTVDPYVAYEHKFDGKDIGGVRFLGMDYEAAFEVEAERGLRISFTKAASTHRSASLPKLLPPKGSEGTVRVSARYFIPKTNRVVDGIRMGPGSGRPLGDILTTRGKWSDGVTTGTVGEDSPSFFLTFNLRDPSAAKEAAADFVVLGSLTVEYIRFAAFIQKRFADTGVPINEQINPELQPALVIDGRIEHP